MPLYMLQVGYTPEAWAALTSNPQDRLQAVVRPLMDQLGGRAVDAWLSFGEYDAIVVYEVPDSVSAAALAMRLSSGGALKSLKTIPLLTIDEGVEAMRKAGSLDYAPPSPR